MVLSKDGFKTLYGSSGTTFPNNTTGEISAEDVRTFGEDIADSLFDGAFSANLNFTVVEIGDWDIDASTQITIPHGIADFTKIRTIQATIRNDANTRYTCTSTEVLCYVESANVTIGVNAFFASADYDSTGYNRGWITIGFVE